MFVGVIQYSSDKSYYLLHGLIANLTSQGNVVL